jgi:pimeloyl-ACP methyl ester carboxylesterase
MKTINLVSLIFWLLSFYNSSTTMAQDVNKSNKTDSELYSDEELIKKLPGFKNHYATVNGIKLHYVEGGKGTPLICLPGWPQTWFSYHPIASELAKTYHVIIIDIRGMGTSDKPKDGYDKKTMAKDVYELTKHLGLDKVLLLGHDIGGMVASSFALNYPGKTLKLVVMDGAHPGEGMMKMPMVPAKGTFKEKMDGQYPYGWWIAFNQVKDLPEKILEGRFSYVLDWLFHYVMVDDTKMSQFDREVYAAAYNNPENIRAGNAWYQSFTTDIEDLKSYPKLEMPVLGIGSYIAYGSMKMSLPNQAKSLQVIQIESSGHFMFEEKPELVLKALTEFFK